MKHDVRRPYRTLGTLEISSGLAVIAGGIQFEPEGTGFLIPISAEPLPTHFPEDSGYVRTKHGEWSFVTDLHLLEASSGLPSRVGFRYCAEVGIALGLGEGAHSCVA